MNRSKRARDYDTPSDTGPKPAHTVTAQMLPPTMSKGSREVNAVMPFQTRAESGAFTSARTDGRVPGLPYAFAFPTIINMENQRHPAGGFGFQGYLEVWNGSEIGTFGCLQSPSPAIKIVGNGTYFQRDARTLGEVVQSTTPLASIGAEWGDLALARSALLTNTEAFFRTPMFEAAAGVASLDERFDVGGAPCFTLTKPRGAGMQCLDSIQSRRFSPTLSRYVIFTNPPPGSHFGATVTAISGGDKTERGTSRPFELTLTRAGEPSQVQKVTLWPSDVPDDLTLETTADLKSTLTNSNLILLLTGMPSETPGGVEYVVRALSEAKQAKAAMQRAAAARAEEAALSQHTERSVENHVCALIRRCWVGEKDDPTFQFRRDMYGRLLDWMSQTQNYCIGTDGGINWPSPPVPWENGIVSEKTKHYAVFPPAYEHLKT